MWLFQKIIYLFFHGIFHPFIRPADCLLFVVFIDFYNENGMLFCVLLSDSYQFVIITSRLGNSQCFNYFQHLTTRHQRRFLCLSEWCFVVVGYFYLKKIKTLIWRDQEPLNMFWRPRMLLHLFRSNRSYCQGNRSWSLFSCTQFPFSV